MRSLCVAAAPMLLCLGLAACVQPVGGYQGYGYGQGGLASQAQTIALEHNDRIRRFGRLASISGMVPPQIDQLAAPPGSVPGVPGPVPVVRVLFDEKVFFESASAVPRPQAEAIFDVMAENMRRDVPDAALTLLGHTDATGSEALNIELSRRRAAAVMAALIRRGVSPGQLSMVAIGKAQPIATNLTADGRARNRRVEFMISGSEQANLAVVGNRSVNLSYFAVAANTALPPPPTRVAVLKPSGPPRSPTDSSFLEAKADLALRPPSLHPEPPAVWVNPTADDTTAAKGWVTPSADPQ